MSSGEKYSGVRRPWCVMLCCVLLFCVFFVALLYGPQPLIPDKRWEDHVTEVEKQWEEAEYKITVERYDDTLGRWVVDKEYTTTGQWPVWTPVEDK